MINHWIKFNYRKVAIFIFIVIILLSVILLRQPHWLLGIISKIAPGVKYFAETDEPIVAMTIDDGPDIKTTSKILDILARHQAHATFFLISERTQKNEAIVARIIEEDHEIGNHMVKDEPSIKLSIDQFEKEFLEADTTLKQIISQTTPYQGKNNRVKWFRPGGGWYNSKMLNIVQKYGYQSALGSIFPYDTHISSYKFAIYQILLNLRPGAIIVLHDSGKEGEWGERTALTLEAILPEIKRRGYRIVTLSEMFPDK